MNKTETVLVSLKAILLAATVPDGALEGVTVERNIAVPAYIPDGGLVIMRDGDPGEPETVLGGFDDVFYEHAIDIEIFSASSDDVARDTLFAAVVAGVGTVLQGNKTLDDTVDGMTYGQPSPGVEAVEGADDIKSATMTLTVNYWASSPLA